MSRSATIVWSRGPSSANAVAAWWRPLLRQLHARRAASLWCGVAGGDERPLGQRRGSVSEFGQACETASRAPNEHEVFALVMHHILEDRIRGDSRGKCAEAEHNARTG